MKKLLILTMLFAALTCRGQQQKLTFTSVTDAKFYVYVNGRLYNDRSSGRVVVEGLEEKDYHIRIVIDDPFAITLTRRIKPDAKHSEYDIEFNPVRERVYMRLTKEQDYGEEQNTTDEEEVAAPAAEETKSPQRNPIRRNTYDDSTTNRIVTRVRTNVSSE